MQRRGLLKLGLFGSALLAGGGLLATYAGRDAVRDRATVLRAVASAVLASALPADGAAREQALLSAVAGSNTAIAGLSPSAQAELTQLFTLLAAAPTRIVLAGVNRPWADASVQEIMDFLQRWRGHSLALMQSGYHALHDLVAGPWYGDSANWSAIGYPGPPSL